MRLLALLLLLAVSAAAEDGVSVEYLAAPRNEALWMVESWHKLPRGFRVEPSVTLFRAPGGSVMHRSFGADVGWEPSTRWDLSVNGGFTAPRDGYRGHHGGFEGTFLVQERAALKAGLGATFTSHADERLGTAAAPFRALETSLGAKLSAELAGGRWTVQARKSLYDRSLPKASIDRYAGFAGGGPSPAHYSPVAATIIRGFHDAAQSLRWDPKIAGPIEFFLQFERSTFVNRRAAAHEYKGGFLWDLGRTGFGLTLRRFDSGVYRPSDGLTFEWRLKLR